MPVLEFIYGKWPHNYLIIFSTQTRSAYSGTSDYSAGALIKFLFGTNNKISFIHSFLNIYTWWPLRSNVCLQGAMLKAK